VQKLVLKPGGMAPRGVAAADTTLVKALARAFRWRRIMEAGRYGTRRCGTAPALFPPW
jgi:hypothetical protein